MIQVYALLRTKKRRLGAGVNQLTGRNVKVSGQGTIESLHILFTIATFTAAKYMQDTDCNIQREETNKRHG
jgi:hypothetical protein